MYLVSGISGSKAADMAAVAPVLFPEMKERGAKPGDLVALLSATGAQTETIPPSLVLITIGSVTGVSISALFTGGLLPGIVLAIMLCAVVWWRYRGEDLSHVKRATKREIGRAFVIAIPAIALPFVIRAAVVKGVATATEVSTIGIVYSVLAGLLIYRQFSWRRIYPMLIETAALSGAILLIIGAATGMAWALTQSGFSASLAKFMTGLPGGVPIFLAVSIVAFVILGSVLEREHVRECGAGLERFERMRVLLRGQDRDFLGRLHVAERELHREPVHLRFGQRIRAAKLDRVLCRDDEEKLRQVALFAIHTDLALAHRFQQRRPSARGSAVDFVSEQGVREDGAFVEMKLLIALVENGNAQNVRRQQVGRELNAFEARINRTRQRFRQRRLARAGKIFEQHVSAAG